MGDPTDRDRSERLHALLLEEPISSLEPAAPVVVTPDATIGEAVRTMKEHRIGCLLVVRGEALVGIVTERDILTKAVGTDVSTETAVGAIMTSDPETLRLEHELVYALNRMSVGGYRHVPLVDTAGRPVGVVSMRNFIDYIVECLASEVLNLPSDPDNLSGRGREGA